MKRIVFVAVACAFVATPALADLVATFHLTNAELTWTAATNRLTVYETTNSLLQVRKEDDVTAAMLDSAQVTGDANFNLLLDLTLAQLGANNWASTTGSLVFTDKNPGNAVEATVQTYYVSLSSGFLLVQGYLGDLALNTSILVNRGDPWVFAGDSETGDTGDADGVPNQVTMFNPENYDRGEVVTLRFSTPGGTLDGLFAQDRTLPGGEVKGVIVPIPAAVLLGLLGLGAAGLKLRKFA